MNDDEIIKRLLEVNEKRELRNDRRFYTLIALFIVMICFYFLCPFEANIVFEGTADNFSVTSQTLSNGVKMPAIRISISC